ncbi:MAG: Na/Pi cotransporter family protein [Ruminococcaceae bacterium]|nr:Na/Pi cotransporter family protein [Oscillospiraceae bacterium]
MEILNTMVIPLILGLTFFMFGMNVMSSGLETMAGGGLERTMKKVTSNDFFGFFLGAGITVAIQSSSAFTVMLVGLVNSGLLNFSNTFGLIMGSNVGTTLTAWLLSLAGLEGKWYIEMLNPSFFAPILAFIGIAMQMFAKSDKKKDLGNIFIGFAILIFGMDLMSDSMVSVRKLDGFDTFLATLKSPIIALLISTVFTGVIQSSAATIGIVQALALSGGITWEMAIPLVLGANIGTCVTALIGLLGTNKNAKRVVVMHFSVNVFGSIFCMIIMYILRALGVSVLTAEIVMVGVAIVHTLFNAINTVILIPVKQLLIKFCEWVVPDGEEQTHTVFLDERIFNNTPLAIDECRRLTCEMAVCCRDAITQSIKLLKDYSAEGVQKVEELETLTDKYEDKLGTYLVRISNNNLTENQSHAVARLLHSIGDFERISDHALNICDAAVEIFEKKITFSKNAVVELDTTSAAVVDILNKAINSFVSDDAELATHVEPLEQVIDDLRATLKERHIERLQKGECTVELGFVFTDILTNYERVSDHCSNIAVYTLQMNSDKLDAHKYLRKLKNSENTNYLDEYKRYGKKYSV